tara:strand:- start:197 stop:361 length:165 start_codon:yes stop_codon:yes gene_type:complete
MKKRPSNWIEGMAIELKQRRRKTLWMNVFVWFVILSGCLLSWIGFIKLIMWLVK